MAQNLHDIAFERQQRAFLSQHFDANETAFLERELEQLRARIITVDYPENKAKQLFPIANDIAVDADTFVWAVEDKTGHAKVAAKGSDDMPRVELQTSERTGKVKTTHIGYGWEYFELQTAARVGKPIQARKALAAAEAMAKLHDKLFATGQDPSLASAANTALGLTGAVNNASIADGGGSSNSRVQSLTHWVLGTTTGQAMCDQLNRVAKYVPDNSKQLYTIDTMAMAPNRYNILASTRMNEFDSRTALQAFLAASPWVKAVEPWLELEGAGVGGLDRLMGYRRSADVLELVEPLAFQSLAPQMRNTEVVVPNVGRCGGCLVYKPLACVYGDFASS